MINQEIRGNLARLLATENLVVEHRKVTTASFDVLRRVLTLPLWDKASKVVYDLLVGHEVGHALYTPADQWDFNVPKDFINVVEDARIEKLMKRKYAGLNKDFYNGYQELNEQDFFDIEGEDLNTFNLIDRINLHFKVGAYARIPFSTEETEYVKKVADCETFDDVLTVCRELKEYLKKQQEQKTPDNLPKSSEEGQQSPTVEPTAETDTEEPQQEETHDSNDSDGDGDRNEADIENTTFGKQGGEAFESQTQKAFDEAAEELTNDRPYAQEPVYVEVPEVNLKKAIVDYDDLQDYIGKYWGDLAKQRGEDWGNIFESVDADFNDFKKSSQKEVNYLVKEFECRKSADAYARAGQSKTGVLNTSKLHTYKYNDDIFKKVTVLPDGKNHGMIFILDWSGSMGNVLMDTVKQLINLCWFCRKVQIPFEVYAFTYEWHDGLLQGNTEEYNYEYAYERKHNMLSVHKRFHLLNLATSRSNSKSFDTSINYLYRLAHYYSRNAIYYHNPMGLDLSGTPLNESLVTLKTLIPEFQKENNLQKVNVCILTDGEGNNLSYDVKLNDYLGNRSVAVNCCLRDRKLGRTYRHFDWEQGNSLSTILLENLKDNFPQVNFIGFRIGNGSDFSDLYKGIHGWKHDHDAVMKKWRKQKSWELHGLGYDSLYVMGQTTLSSDVEFDVEVGAKKTAISKSFRSMLKAKTTNKKILSSFATVIS
tara:strand:- start:766 stop:2886 length:2121 start_codon:yes stop_codon:yes gene_type:complete